MRILKSALFPIVAVSILSSVSNAQFTTRANPKVEATRISVSAFLETNVDRGATIAEDFVTEDIASILETLRSQIYHRQIDDAKSTLKDIFSLLPQSDVGFNRLLILPKRSTRHVVTALRNAVKQAGHLAVSNAALNITFLELITERMERHRALAGTNGRQFLEIFSIWTSSLSELRRYGTGMPRVLGPGEHDSIEHFEKTYDTRLAGQMCSQIFAP